jgi:hypothetical protein
MKKMRSPAPSSLSTLLMGLPRSTDKARSEAPAHRYAQLLLQKSHDLWGPRKNPLIIEPWRHGIASTIRESNHAARLDAIALDYRLNAAPGL